MTVVRRVAIVLFYLLIAFLALDALIANFTTAMPGIVKLQASNAIQPSEFDIFFWNLWWVRHAIFDLHVSPLYTNFVVYPFVSPLAGHTLALLWGFVSAPFQMIFGLIPTFNAHRRAGFCAGRRGDVCLCAQARAARERGAAGRIDLCVYTGDDPARLGRPSR